MSEHWDAGCDLCGWSFSDELSMTEFPLASAGEACWAALDHRCEPALWVSDPSGKRYRPDDFDPAGKLREAVDAA